jgi:hypothetical protein
MSKKTLSFQGIIMIDQDKENQTGFVTVETTIDGLTLKKKHQFFFEPGTTIKQIGERVVSEIFFNS